MSLEFVEFDRDDLPQRHELFANSFPEQRDSSIASSEHYSWKFHGTSFDPQSYEYAARDGDRLLGYYAAIPYPYRIADRNLMAAMVCDVMTHPEARGRGVFTGLGRFALDQMQAEGLDFATGYPIRPGVMGGHLRAGWQVAFELPMFLKPLRANAMFARRRMSWLAPPANLIIGLHRAVFSARHDDEACQIEAGSPADMLVADHPQAFLDEWGRSVPNRLIKSADFYTWRLGAPGTSYRVFMVRRDGTLLALAVTRAIELQGVPSLALLDLMMSPAGQASLAALYRELEREALSSGAEAIVTMMSKRRAREYRLSRFGYLKTPFKFKLILRGLNLNLGDVLSTAEDDWHLMWIDSDDL